MNYSETIAYLYKKLPMFSRIGPPAFKHDLDNTIALCESLGNPHQKIKTIHVAGTNGKGSVSHILAAILQTAGYKTGLYTSPHLKDFRERIKINGAMIPKDFVISFTKKITPLIEKIEPSFFEITVAMAFDFFANENVDIAIIETGLGGRLDSTNIIIPELSVITNIGWDHTNMLGDTLAKIAGEKAGIIKKRIPVVVGETLTETKSVFERKALLENAPIIFANEIRTIEQWHWETNQLNVSVHSLLTNEMQTYLLDLPGIYQTKNLLTVLAAVDELNKRNWNISKEQIFDGLRKAKKMTGLFGRWDIIHNNPTVVIDVAHNEDGVRQLVQQIEMMQFNNLHIVIGMVKDKEVDKVLSMMPKNAHYYFTKAQVPRAITEDELASKAVTIGLKGKTFADVNMALYSACTQSKKDDLIIVCGSVFLAGEIHTAAVNEMLKKGESSFFDLDWFELFSLFD